VRAGSQLTGQESGAPSGREAAAGPDLLSRTERNRQRRQEMSGRIAAAAVLVALFAACIAVPTPALAGEKEYKVVIETDDEGGGWLGIGIMELDDKLRDKLDVDEDIEGIVVTEIYDDSPAEDAGLKEHDIVISIDGEKGKDLSHFVKLVKSKDPGAEVEIQIYRDGKMKKVNATLAEREDTFVWTMKDLEGLEGLEALGSLEALAALDHIVIPEIDLGVSSWGRRGRLGVYIEDVSGDLAEYFEIPGGEGVLVEGVVEDSPAEAAGIQAGDIIYKIGGYEICCTEELVKAISKMETGAETPIVLIRKGKQVTVMATVEESEYDKAMQEYKIQLENLGDKDIIIRGLKSDELTEEEKAELKAELKELQEELQELRKELKELATDKD
jgi:C-terminal processing protease CtpA/Prc